MKRARNAAEIDWNLIGIFVLGYTDYTRGAVPSDLTRMKSLVQECGVRSLLRADMDAGLSLRTPFHMGVWAAVVGTAITRPREINQAVCGCHETVKSHQKEKTDSNDIEMHPWLRKLIFNRAVGAFRHRIWS